MSEQLVEDRVGIVLEALTHLPPYPRWWREGFAPCAMPAVMGHAVSLPERRLHYTRVHELACRVEYSGPHPTTGEYRVLITRLEPARATALVGAARQETLETRRFSDQAAAESYLDSTLTSFEPELLEALL